MSFIEDEDYYFDENGLMVLTSEYLRKRGYCCGNQCRNCPYSSEKQSEELEDSEADLRSLPKG